MLSKFCKKIMCNHLMDDRAPIIDSHPCRTLGFYLDTFDVL